MSVAASDEDGSDEKPSVVRRRTITGGTACSGGSGQSGTVPTSHADEDSDSETSHPAAQPGERTRQKKFIKYFKDLPEEICTVRISCALVGDILLQGHLYVTHNYIGFHSNVFGYVTKIKLPMISVTAITKEKTARIIPNAVAVCCEGEKHIFTSFMSRDATFNTITKAWRRALARNDINSTVNMEGDTLDGSLKGRNYDSSDSETFANPEWSRGRTSHRRLNVTKLTTSSPSPSPSPSSGSSGSLLSSLPSSVLLLCSMLGLLVLLLLSSVYLVLRLGHIQDRMEETGALDLDISAGQHLDKWHNIINSRSSKKVQEYINSNLDQISKVRENLEKLSSILVAETKREEP